MSDLQSAVSGAQVFSLFLGVIIAVVGGFLSVTNYVYSRKKDRFNSLFGVFNYLNDLKHREARRVLYYNSGPNPPPQGSLTTSSMIILGFDASSQDVIRVSKDIVRDDMDQMGLMVKSGLIPEKEFLERYWKTVIDCRSLLESDISLRRELRGYEDYLHNFDFLRDRASKYAEKNDLFKEPTGGQV